MNPFQKLLKTMTGAATPAPELSENTKELFLAAQVEDLEEKLSEAAYQLALANEKYDKLKLHCDDISNRNALLESEHTEIITNNFGLKLKTLSTDDKILCVTVQSKSFLDHKTFARLNHQLRNACPWLDLVFMIHEDVELAGMTDADLKVIGLQRTAVKEDKGDLCSTP